MLLTSWPLVSIVTPVYNTEKYLAECIQSVLAQTYENWEYVIVDNCSTDRSVEIAQRYAQRDPRIRLYQNDRFLNQMQNWNHAMRQISADSKYCKVVHADDWLFPECIARTVECAEAHPEVGIVSAYRLDETTVNLDGLPYPSTAVPGHEIGRAALKDGLHVFGSPTSLLIRSALVRQRPIFYDESTVCADSLVCFELLQECDLGFVHQVLTFTRRHNESVTSLTHRFDTRRLGWFIALLRYGPIYLSDQEYEERLRQAIDSYYAFLARSALELREKAFWDYHRTEMGKLGYPIRWSKVGTALLLQLLDLRQSVRSVRMALRERKRRVSLTGKTGESVLSSIYNR